MTYEIWLRLVVVARYDTREQAEAHYDGRLAGWGVQQGVSGWWHVVHNGVSIARTDTREQAETIRKETMVALWKDMQIVEVPNG